MDDFQGNSSIVIQTHDSEVPYAFRFPACSAEDVNDGAIPYGTTISSCAATAKNAETGLDASAALIKSVTVDDDKVTLELSYPGAVGTFHITFVLTLSTGAKIEKDFIRVMARD